MEQDKQPLHLKYRPKSFDELIGNNSIIESLSGVLKRNAGLVRAFLLQGPSGCGKTTIARIMKSELGCSDKDFHEFNMANTRGIDTIRELAISSCYFPIDGNVKIYLIDECHKLTTDAQNALLKLLEDTPEHVRFILCTTDPEKLIGTIRTRCSTYQVNKLITPLLIQLLKFVCEKEGTELPADILKEIARASDGSPRKALVTLDQIIDVESLDKIREIISEIYLGEATTLELCRALLGKDWETVSDLLKKLEQEPETIRYAVLGYFNAALLRKAGDRIADIISVFSDSFIYSGKAGLSLASYLACK